MKFLDAEQIVFRAMKGKNEITIPELVKYVEKFEKKMKSLYNESIYCNLSRDSIYTALQYSSQPIKFQDNKIFYIPMNPNILFRVWDNIFKEYWSTSEIKNNAAWLLFPDNQNERNITVERCTYADDMTGTLIYEGDILKASNGNISIVKFKDWRFILDSEADHEGSFRFTRGLKIIGTIHDGEQKDE